jgi:hypothetical protein
MKKLLMMLAIVFVVGVIGSIFIPQNLDAGLEDAKDPREDHGGFIICYNYEKTSCK